MPSPRPLPEVVAPGRPDRLGATWDGRATTVAVWSSTAEQVDVCVEGPDGGEVRLPLPARSGDVWHGRVEGLVPGDRYGLRVDGPWDPARGLRHNPSKLLADPYALAFDGEYRLDDAVFGHRVDSAHGRVEPSQQDHRDSGPFVPRGVVVDPAFPWGADRHPRTPWRETVVYELHVKGFTRRLPGVPEHLRGTYAGLAHPAAIEHLLDLGVTAVELLPVHQSTSEAHLLRRGLVNYWGYNTLGYLAPHAAYAATGTRGQQVAEFQAMVRALHDAGLEVLLDVVYNHTCEGDALSGPTLSLRGLDNAGYYRLDPADPSRCLDSTGCGNTVDCTRLPGMRLVLDSLRHWVSEMHVDGFRFDLMPSLARSDAGVDLQHGLVAALRADPLLARTKLVAEPWDLGHDGYQVGRFPHPFAEWNGRYRDTVRRFWLRTPAGEGGSLPELGARLTGSADLYAAGGRSPWASVNFVTAHDGFTLRDLVTYERKRNEANGEDNRDGDDHGSGWNAGHEGEGGSRVVLERRRRLQRSMLATLLVSAGTPMLLAGDELGRSQVGNNNAYCQDNRIAWLDWEDADADLHALVRRLVGLRRSSPALRRPTHPLGRVPAGRPVEDVYWFSRDGRPMSSQEWNDPATATVGMFVDGAGLDAVTEAGVPLRDSSWLVLLHAARQDTTFRLPGAPYGTRYEVAVDTAARPPRPGAPSPAPLRAGADLPLRAHALVLLRVLV